MIVILYGLCCVFYAAMQILMGTISVLNEKIFNYSPLAVTMFYINIFYPINFIQYGYYYPFENVIEMKWEHFKDISIASVIYNIECVATFWALQYIPISFYIIGRTFTAFVNVLFSKYYLIKIISNWYYLGLTFLSLAYILIALAYDNQNFNINEKISVLIIIASSFTTSTYNNMAEKFFDDLSKESPEIMDEMRIKYRLVFNAYGFAFVGSGGLIMALYNDQFISDFGPNILYVIAGLCYQTNILVKLFILGSKNFSGNQVLTCLDLGRRIVTNVIGYTFFGDYYNTMVVWGNIMIMFGCFFIMVGIIKN